jgi:hypothetical protein
LDIKFLIKRFFYSFLSGCILIFFVIIYYYTLQHTIELPSYFYVILKFIRIGPYFVFVISALFISIIIEGICQIGLEEYLPIKGKKEFFKREILLELIFIRPSILEVCERLEKDIENKKKDFNPLKDFIKDSGLTKEKHFFNCCVTYNALYICATILERDKKLKDINHYRENSYIIQMLRLAFFCIAILTAVSGILFIISRSCNIWHFKTCEKFKDLVIFIFVTFLISIFSIWLLTIISRSFAKRFIREVGYSYEAMKFEFPKKMANL